MIAHLQDKLNGMLGIFKFFMDGTWIFESQKILNVLQEISPEEQLEFNCDVRNIDWLEFLGLYVNGIAIWCLGEDEIDPNYGFTQVLIKQAWYKNDFNLSMIHQKDFVNKNSKIYERDILNQERFKQYLFGIDRSSNESFSFVFN